MTTQAPGGPRLSWWCPQCHDTTEAQFIAELTRVGVVHFEYRCRSGHLFHVSFDETSPEWRGRRVAPGN